MSGASIVLNGSRLLVGLMLIGANTFSSAQDSTSPEGASEFRKISDIEYAVVDGHKLGLDVYLPANVSRPPLLVWVHGGAWERGSKAGVPAMPFIDAGYAIASVDYRLSPVAQFPAQVHDIKAAIRFLRANASRYGYDGSAIGIMGSSAGGHLAALVGSTNGHAALEGKVGAHLDESSDVQGVVSYFGASDFTTILEQSVTSEGADFLVSVLGKLLGGHPRERAELARLASPVAHVDRADPPLLLLHGDQDVDIPMAQASQLHDVYKERGAEVQFHVISGAGHGGDQFFDGERNQLVVGFLDAELQSDLR